MFTLRMVTSRIVYVPPICVMVTQVDEHKLIHLREKSEKGLRPPRATRTKIEIFENMRILSRTKKNVELYERKSKLPPRS